MGITYKDSGVDIEAGDEVVKNIKPLIRSTFNENVLTDIGLFGGFYEANFGDYKQPVLVSSVDGVGTKLKIAFATGVHNTVGQCLVNHCVNDILSCGAKPLFFLDYFSVGKLVSGVAEKVIEGFATACKENGCALIGGETAEMPSIYEEGEYDISGTVVGVVDKKEIVNGKDIKAGDFMIGFPSNGLHTNGYSLARAVLLKERKVGDYIDSLGKTLGEELLAVHKSYYKTVYPLIKKGLVKGISHITGGGIVGNTGRILPKGVDMKIDWNSWEVPPIFRLIKDWGEVEEKEMRRTFNMGVGMILIADKEKTDEIIRACSSEKPVVVGEIVSS